MEEKQRHDEVIAEYERQRDILSKLKLPPRGPLGSKVNRERVRITAAALGLDTSFLDQLEDMEGGE